ncbi:MAG: PAS domain-containing protein [Deltaproteobacteria bacterium]|nr:PAS domain-containing protein [Deltaproteobacteria bacterium]
MTPGSIQEWIHEKLFHQVPVDIAVIDRKYRIVEANRNFRQRYGEWRGKHCYEVYKARDSRCARCVAAKTFEDGGVRVNEEQGIDKQGSKTHYMVHLAPLRDDSGGIRFVIEMSTDVTRVHELQEQLRVTEVEKIEAERLAAVGQTVAGLAHGVKNILMGLEGGMYVLKSGISRQDGNRIARGWEMLEGNMERISKFVREFLDFARGSEPSVSMADPNELVRQVVDLYKEAAAKDNVEIVARPGSNVQPVPMDVDGIHTCLANLVSNAVDACMVSNKKTGKVVVKTTDDGDQLVFEVTDDGVGMDYDVKKKIFTSFFSTKAVGKGTGLGLLVTKRITMSHGGRVEILSEQGKGSTFRLIFPKKRLPKVTGGQEGDGNT